MGRDAREFVGTSRGALGRVMENIKAYLDETKGPAV
jgi:hypothetical protein